MSLKKQYLKNQPICKVTFQINETQGKLHEAPRSFGISMIGRSNRFQ